MKTLTAFLSLVLPQLGPILLQAPQLAALFRDAFKRVGGTDEELDKLLDENKKLIDKLGNPDAYRHVPPPAPPQPEGFSYWPATHTAQPDESELKSGDRKYSANDRQDWTVWSPDLGRPLPPVPPWTLEGVV